MPNYSKVVYTHILSTHLVYDIILLVVEKSIYITTSSNDDLCPLPPAKLYRRFVTQLLVLRKQTQCLVDTVTKTCPNNLSYVHFQNPIPTHYYTLITIINHFKTVSKFRYAEILTVSVR